MSADIALDEQEQATLDRLAEAAADGDHYAMLDVDEDADRTDIQKAYHGLSRRWHPDRYFRKELGDYREKLESVFIAITDAYRTLSNDASRKAYDLERPRRPRKRRRSSARPAGESTPPTDRPGRRSSLAEGRAAGRSRRLKHGGNAPRPPRKKRTGAATSSGRTPAMSKAMGDMRKQLRRRLKRAKELHAEGLEHLEAGNVLKAASALEMATSFDPRNKEYKAAADKARKAARKQQAKSFVALAESAESFANTREAIAHYQKAVDYEVEEARPYYRLGVLLHRVENDSRAALEQLRVAVSKAPTNIDYRMALGELYAELGLKVNAEGQYKRVLAMDKDHAEAKAALKSL